MPFFKAYPMIPLSCNLAGRYLEEQGALSMHKSKFSQAVQCARLLGNIVYQAINRKSQVLNDLNGVSKPMNLYFPF